MSLKHSWPWIAKRTAGAIDVIAGIAIDRWTNREALAAGDAEREEVEQNLAEYGEQKLGRIEAPLWFVLVVSLGIMVANKYIGAPEKPKPIEDKPEGKLLSMPAPAADTTVLDAASDAGRSETDPPLRSVARPEATDDGSVDDAPTGF